MHFIGRGAEAILYKKNSHLIKKRISKGYRIDVLDEKLRKERTAHEIKLLIEARRNKVHVPMVVEKNIKDAKIIMEFIEGDTLRDVFNKLKPVCAKDVCKKIGTALTKLHDAGIIHGDLTTSNMILNKNEVYFVDFGLGKISQKVEEKAVDIHLLKSALISKHHKIWQEAFIQILKHYTPKDKDKIMTRLGEIEKRGRYAIRD